MFTSTSQFEGLRYSIRIFFRELHTKLGTEYRIFFRVQYLSFAHITTFLTGYASFFPPAAGLNAPSRVRENRYTQTVQPNRAAYLQNDAVRRMCL